MFFRRSPEKRKHVAGLLRAFAYLSVVAVGCGALSVRAARAEVGEKSLAVGRQIYELSRAFQNDVTPVTLNGQQMFMGSSLSHDAVGDVLERYHDHCVSNAAQTPESWRALTSEGAAPAKAAKPGLLGDGVLRAGDDKEGTVVCFVRSQDAKPSATEAFKAFAETGELGAIGQLRYVYAKRTEQGNTHVMTVWTTAKFSVRDLVPEEGKDAPGQDYPYAPRLPDSQRILSARVDGTTFGINVYRTKMPPGDVAAFYDEKMVAAGWNAIDAELDEEEAKPVGHLYEKDGVVLTLAAHLQQGETIAGLGLAGVEPYETKLSR